MRYYTYIAISANRLLHIVDLPSPRRKKEAWIIAQNSCVKNDLTLICVTERDNVRNRQKVEQFNFHQLTKPLFL